MMALGKCLPSLTQQEVVGYVMLDSRLAEAAQDLLQFFVVMAVIVEPVSPA